MRSEGLDQSKVGETSQQPSAEKSEDSTTSGCWRCLALASVKSELHLLGFVLGEVGESAAQTQTPGRRFFNYARHL